KRRMKEAAMRVKNGDFAREWVEEYSRGAPTLKRLMEEAKGHQIEKVGEEMRRLIFAL
ncbi:MAG: ketol-acid reductoisomerase, partial [Pyrobaculum sp.]